jgi:ribose transport system ATP-binding protein
MPGVKSEREVLLHVAGVSKTFPGLAALSDVSLELHAGEIIAVVGHNGSGKSTLVKLLAGVYTPDEGGDLGVSHGSGVTRATRGRGAELHFIHQSLGLVDLLSTVDNFNVTRAYKRRGLLPLRQRRERLEAQALLGRFGARFDVTEPVSARSAPERAVIAIARALSGWDHDRNVLLLDEPTEALHASEVDELFRVVRAVAKRGAGVVFISHRLDEVFELADRIVVLRDGEVVADTDVADTDREHLVSLIAGARMQGDGIEHHHPDQANAAGAVPRLTVRGLRGCGVQGIDFDVLPGELVGLSGLLGSGREHVNSLLFGAAPGESDTLEVDGRELGRLTPARAIASGLGYVPANRAREGAVMSLSLRENVTLPRLSPFRAAFGWLRTSTERAEVSTLIDEFEVRPPRMEQPLSLFSGGNQQKAVLAKWLRNDPAILLLDEPTQGVDIGAKDAIYAAVRDSAAKGAAVLVSSADTKELVDLCDRVIVLNRGQITTELRGSQLTEADLVSAVL